MKSINLKTGRYKGLNSNGRTLDFCILSDYASINYKGFHGKGLHNKVKFLLKLAPKEFEVYGNGKSFFNLAKLQLALYESIKDSGLNPIMHKIGLISPMAYSLLSEMKDNKKAATYFKKDSRKLVSDGYAVYIAYCMRNKYKIEDKSISNIPWIVEYNKGKYLRDPEVAELEKSLDYKYIRNDEYHRLYDIKRKYEALKESSIDIKMQDMKINGGIKNE